MTNGQRMIWAAVYAAERMDWKRLCSQVGKEFDDDVVASTAAENASAAVEAAIYSVGDIADGFGDEDMVTVRLKDMVYDR